MTLEELLPFINGKVFLLEEMENEGMDVEIGSFYKMHIDEKNYKRKVKEISPISEYEIRVIMEDNRKTKDIDELISIYNEISDEDRRKLIGVGMGLMLANKDKKENQQE